MRTDYTTFAKQFGTSYSSEVTKSTYSYTNTTQYTSATTYSTSGTHKEYFTDTSAPGTLTLTSTSQTSGTLTLTSNTTTSANYTYTITFNTDSSSTNSSTQSSSSSYNTTEYSLFSSKTYTAGCSIPPSTELNSFTYTISVAGKGIGSYSEYDTTFHNAPSAHTISEETYRSLIYTTSSSNSSSVTNTDTYTTAQSYTSSANGATITSITYTAIGYTTGTLTYTTSTASNVTSSSSTTASQIGLYYETHNEGNTLYSSQIGVTIIYQSGTNKSSLFSSYRSTSFQYSYSNYFSFNDTFTFIDAIATGYSSQSQSFSGTESGLASYYSSDGWTRTTSESSSYYSFTSASTLAQGGSTYASQNGSTSTTSFIYSTASQTQFSITGRTTYISPTLSTSVLIPNIFTTVSVQTTYQTTGNYAGTYFISTGTTTLSGASSVNTTKSTFSTALFKTTSITNGPLSLTYDITQSSTLTNSIVMDTASIFIRQESERMFSISTTGTNPVVLSNALKEITRYSAIPVYTNGPSSSSESYTTISATSRTFKTGTSATAYMITNRTYSNSPIVISQTNGTTVCPIGAYNQSTTMIYYLSGIYDITSRSMSDTNVTTNTTEQITVGTAGSTETIINADKNIYPRFTMIPSTTTTSSTFFSLLAPITFNTTSLANP